MKSYCALAILAVLIGANAQGDPSPSCSKQMELEHRCMLNVETSPEAQMIKDRMKQAKKTCVPDYPAECHAEMEAAHDCAVSIAKNADSDPDFQKSKSESGPAVDACFDKYPVDIKKGVMEIFMMGKPGMHKGGHKGGHHGHKKHHNESSSASGEHSGEKHSGEKGEGASASSESNSNETSAERHHGGGGKHHGGGGHGGHGGKGHHCRPHRHHGPRNFTSGESNSNESSSSASKEHRGGRSGEQEERSQCRKTEEQKQCIKGEFQKLAKDTAFVDVINTLIHQKQKCKQTVTWSCEAKCPKKRKCVWKATKPCREAFMSKMKTCLGDKGFTLPPFMLKEHTEMFTTPMPDVTPTQ